MPHMILTPPTYAWVFIELSVNINTWDQSHKTNKFIIANAENEWDQTQTVLLQV